MILSREKTRAASAKTLKRLSGFLSYGLLIGVAFLLMLPIIWLLITSLKQNTEYLSYPIVFLPAVPQWNNYAQVFAPVFHFLRHAGMTTVLAAAYSTLCVLTSALSGYAFARYRDVKATRRLFGIIIALLLTITMPLTVLTWPAANAPSAKMVPSKIEIMINAFIRTSPFP
jgi:ABC-type glycerol-3-phosphate transport system permease component